MMVDLNEYDLVVLKTALRFSQERIRAATGSTPEQRDAKLAEIAAVLSKLSFDPGTQPRRPG